jgi:dihydrofolate reductase
MAKVRAHNISTSLDGYAAGPAQDLENPMGIGGHRLHEWVWGTEFGLAMIGQQGGSAGIDNDFMRAGVDGIGATVMGRNMFGPIRGEWPDESWIGWWEEEPPFHHDVFVLTHHPRADLELTGTTFHFVTDGLADAVERAKVAAGGQDVRIGGGTATIRACLAAGLIDELHIVVSPVLLGAGERLLGGPETDGYAVIETVPSDTVTHYRLGRA